MSSRRHRSIACIFALALLASCSSSESASEQRGSAGSGGTALDDGSAQAGGSAQVTMPAGGSGQAAGAPPDSTPACQRLCAPEAALDCATKRTLEQCMSECLEGVKHCPGKLEEWLLCDEMPEVLCLNGIATLNSRVRRCGAIVLQPPYCWTRQVLAGQGGAPTAGAGGAGCVGGFDGGSDASPHVEPVAPPDGGACPVDGLALCTKPMGGAGDAMLSRCEAGAWRTVEQTSACSSMPQECNVGDVTDGACCDVVRYCEGVGLCDGQRWWR